MKTKAAAREREGVNGYTVQEGDALRCAVQEGDVILTLEIRHLGRVSPAQRARIAAILRDEGFGHLTEALQDVAIVFVPVAKARA